MARHSAEANRIRRDLDRELAAVSAATGKRLAWDTAESAVIQQIVSSIDRKVHLERTLAAVLDDPALYVKVSGEIRLIETHVARMLKQVKPEVPKRDSTRTQKARAAAQARWGTTG